MVASVNLSTPVFFEVSLGDTDSRENGGQAWPEGGVDRTSLADLLTPP